MNLFVDVTFINIILIVVIWKSSIKVEVVWEYIYYFGILMSCNGSMSKNIARLKDVASRAMLLLLKRLKG